MEVQIDIMIIGGGVIGCAVARELSRYNASILLAERGSDVAEGASKANSGIVHAGYDALPGTLKARFNVEGAALFPGLCKELSVPYKQCGALIIGFSEEDEATLKKLLERGIRNGVSQLEIIGKEEILRLEPQLNPEVRCALLVPTSGIVSPYELTFALADDAALNGVRFVFDSEITSVIRRKDGLFECRTADSVFIAKTVINCAGAASAGIHNQLSADHVAITPRRGQYYLLDRAVSLPFERTIFQCPSKMGKGVLVSPTVHGNTLLGPSAEDIDDMDDTSTTQEGLDFVLNKARLTWPDVSTRTNITNFSGIRAHEAKDDFIIGRVEGCPGAWEAVGIESPGLSSAPAIARFLAGQIAEDQNLSMKKKIAPYLPPAKPFREMSDDEKAKAVEENPLYGNIICRCETITEAEITDAIHRPVGARSIDAVKRRTRAGMGRCQGGFCSPRVAAILSRETGIPMTDITKNGGNSFLLTGTLDHDRERSVSHD